MDTFEAFDAGSNLDTDVDTGATDALTGQDDSVIYETGSFDTNGDGVVDTSNIDTNNDGATDAIRVDLDGDGVADAEYIDSNFDGRVDIERYQWNGDGVSDAEVVDTDFDGTPDQTLFDLDNDGTYDHTTDASGGFPGLDNGAYTNNPVTTTGSNPKTEDLFPSGS
jgi:hypothetical protein